MKRLALLSFFVVSALIFTGCGDAQKRFMVETPGPAVFETLSPSAATEVAMAEEIAQKRLAYRRQLEELKAYYTQAGNVMKLEWVEKELASLASAPRYRYIIQAEVAGGELLASDSIPEADKIYDNAVALYKKATRIPIITSKENLRLALAKFNSLIKDFPTSDKIDDSAYVAGRIHERFSDYAIAILYYKRAFTWDAETPYAARYRAARILDTKLSEYSEALKLYQSCLETETDYINEDDVEAVKLRIEEITAPPKTEKID